MSDVSGYMHVYTDEEAQRLIDQAEFLAPWVFDGVDLTGVGTLLEVGMGVGAETRLLRARWPRLRVLGCDIADAAFVCWLLEHVPDPAAVMRECARVVKPGGRIFVTEVYNHSLTVEPTQP